MPEFKYEGSTVHIYEELEVSADHILKEEEARRSLLNQVNQSVLKVFGHIMSIDDRRPDKRTYKEVEEVKRREGD